MVRYYSKNGLSGEETELRVKPMFLKDLKHPENNGWIKDLFLVRALVCDVEVNNVEQLVDYSGAGCEQQGFEHIHKELFVKWIKLCVSMVTLICVEINGDLLFFFLC